MTSGPLSGITWDHPRGYSALEAFGATADPSIPSVLWDRQPLEAFESRPVHELAQTYELIVLDHPSIGDAQVRASLTPMDEIFFADELRRWARRSAGPAWSSYTYAGKQWALPIDAATQACVYRPDRLNHAITTWDDVLALPPRTGLTLCLGGPHALLTLLALTSGLGAPTDDSAFPLLNPGYAKEALRLMQALWTTSDKATSLLNPIGVHEELARRDDLSCCPLVYTYASYVTPSDSASRALRFADAPSASDRPPGSILGGTGLAVAKRASSCARVAGFVRAYLRDESQRRTVSYGGQPAEAAVWATQSNDVWSQHYRGTVRSLRSATIRPRHAGWIEYQGWASAEVRTYLKHATDPRDAIAALNTTYASRVPSPHHDGAEHE